MSDGMLFVTTEAVVALLEGGKAYDNATYLEAMDTAHFLANIGPNPLRANTIHPIVLEAAREQLRKQLPWVAAGMVDLSDLFADESTYLEKLLPEVSEVSQKASPDFGPIRFQLLYHPYLSPG